MATSKRTPKKRNVADVADDTTPLLTYLFPTQPSPLQTSPSNGTSSGYVNVVASPNGSTVYCQEIDIYVAVGTGEGYLTANKPTVTPNTTNWVIASSAMILGRDAKIFPASMDNVNYVQYNCKAVASSEYEISYDLQFSINVQDVDSTVGPYTIGIVENSSPDGTTYSEKNAVYSLNKSGPTFYVNNFISSQAGSGSNPNVPSGEFSNGEAVVLSWQGNGTAYKVFEAGSASPIYSGADTAYTISDGLTQTTSFILQAEVTGGPDSGTTSPGYEAIFLYESLTVKVTNPDETPKTITASGDISTAADLSVTGETTTGTLSVGSTLGVTGTSTLAAVNINDNLGVTGTADLTTLNASGVSTLSGGLVNTGGSVQMISDAVELYSSTAGTGENGLSFQANTDGMVVAYCDSNSDYNDICVYWFYVISDQMQVGGQGGTDQTRISLPNTISLPVQKGSSFTIYSTPWNLNVQSTTVTFKFFPFGSGTATSTGSTDSVEKIEERPWRQVLSNRPDGAS